MEGDKEERKSALKLRKLNEAIYDYQSDERGRGERMKPEILKKFVHEIEKYV